MPDGSTLSAGEQVATELLASKSFAWSRVSVERARSGVLDGSYAFALVIPDRFSAAFAATADYRPTQARLQLLTNDANSYIATTIAERVAGEVRDGIATAVGEEAATTFLTGMVSVRAGLVSAAKGAGQLSDGADEAEDGAAELADGAGELSSSTATLAEGLDRLAAGTASLPAQTRRLADGASQVAAGNAKIASVATKAGDAADDIVAAYDRGGSDLRARLNELDLTAEQRTRVLAAYTDLGTAVRAGNTRVQTAVADVTRLSRGAAQVAAGTSRLAASTPALVSGIRAADAGAGELTTGVRTLATGAGSLRTGLGSIASGATDLATQLKSGAAEVPSSTEQTRNRMAEVIGDPVAVSSISDATAGSYGAGLAPFFLSLAAWIGGYVLFTQIRPLSRRATTADQLPIRVSLGGWLAPTLVGAVQMTLAVTVVSLAVGITPADLPATFAFIVLASAVFIAVIQALCAWLGLAGQFLGLVMMVIQLVTAGGTFPWQTIPQPLHLVHHVMPMSYAVDGMRQLMYGGLYSLVWRDVAVLLVWFVVAVLATSWAARRQRTWTARKLVLSLAT